MQDKIVHDSASNVKTRANAASLSRLNRDLDYWKAKRSEAQSTIDHLEAEIADLSLTDEDERTLSSAVQCDSLSWIGSSRSVRKSLLKLTKLGLMYKFVSKGSGVTWYAPTDAGKRVSGE